jgi:hypothetical protein
VDYEEER